MVTGSSPSGGKVQTDLAPISYTEQFYKQLPYYLAFGMSWEEFWNDDCVKAKYYRKAFEVQKKQENQKLWMLGAYFYEALCDVAPVLHAFAKKGTKPVPYLTEPFAMSKKEVAENQKIREEKKYQKIKDKMQSYAERFNKSRAAVEREVKQDG